VSERAILRTITEPEVVDGHEYWNCNIVLFDGQTYIFSHRAILTLVTVAACNAACKFCSNEITFTPKSPYLRVGPRLERALAFAHTAGVTKIAYTGGEPTAAPQKLYDLVRGTAPGFERARLHTNGFGLLREVDTDDGGRELLLDALIRAGLTGASLSVAHYDPDINHAVMRHKGSWHGITPDELHEIALRAGETFNPRLSCVLTHDGLHSIDDMLRYIDWGVSLGIKRFIFRSCAGIPERYRKPTDYAEYNADNYVPIDPIVETLSRRPDVRETYAQHKSDSHVHVLRIGDVSVDVDESSEEPDSDPKIRRLNVMPNQVVYTSWIDPLATLFPEDRPLALAAARREGVVPDPVASTSTTRCCTRIASA
jgi:molybdenum cofactor biosynthesis enzyme MoaA